MPTIFKTLGVTTTDQLTKYLRDGWHPTTSLEGERRRDIRMRLDLYKDRGRPHFCALLDKLFKNPKVRQLRRELLELSEFQNVTARVVREISTVYSEPAMRKVRKSSQKTFKKFQERVRYDRAMRKVNRLGNLCNEVLVWPDVADAGTEYARPVMRVITPDKFTVIPHPGDPLCPVAFIVDQFPSYKARVTAPHYLGITDTEFFWLDKNWRFVSRLEHGLGMMPALLWHREEPDECILDHTSGRDLMSAHLAITLLNVMMMKHQKSGTRQAYATGDTSDVSRDQPMEEESIIELGEGVTLNTLDLGADPENYIKAGRSVLKQIAANRGIPESVFDLSYQATSGFEIELKRTGLREIRRDQILVFRPFEMELAQLWSKLLSAAGSEYAFDATAFSVNFGQVETPQDPQAKLAYWEKLESMGLYSVVEMMMEMNPEMSEEEAVDAVDENIKRRLAKIRAFQVQEMSPDQEKPAGGQPSTEAGAAEAGRAEAEKPAEGEGEAAA